jgi:predicted secreted protein
MTFGRGPMRPRPPSSVREFTDPDRIDVGAGEPFAVVLSDNGPGGYLWRVTELPPALRLVREDDLAPGEGAPGATGEKVFELEAVEAGTFTLRFERRRDWEPGADRERAVVVNVAP